TPFARLLVMAVVPHFLQDTFVLDLFLQSPQRFFHRLTLFQLDLCQYRFTSPQGLGVRGQPLTASTFKPGSGTLGLRGACVNPQIRSWCVKKADPRRSAEFNSASPKGVPHPGGRRHDAATAEQIPRFDQRCVFESTPGVSGCVRPARQTTNQLAFNSQPAHGCNNMGLPRQTVPLSPEQVADLNRKLSDLRHNVNNHLALMVAALELIRRKPDMVARLVNNLTEQPQKILDEIKKISEELERALKITRH